MPFFRFGHFDQKIWKQCFLQISSLEFTTNSEHSGHLNFSKTLRNEYFTKSESKISKSVDQSFLKVFDKFKCPKCSAFVVNCYEEICRKYCFQFFGSKQPNLKNGIFHVFGHRAKTKMIPSNSIWIQVRASQTMKNFEKKYFFLDRYFQGSLGPQERLKSKTIIFFLNEEIVLRTNERYHLEGPESQR